jgi:hypothetical protein
MGGRKSGGYCSIHFWDGRRGAAIPTAPAKKKKKTEHGYQQRGNAHCGGLGAKREKKTGGKGKERTD